VKLGRGVPPPPLDFYKVITPKAFDLNQIIYDILVYDHQQVDQAGKNGDAPKEVCHNFKQQCLNAFISSGPRKLNYCRLEEFYFLFIFYFEQKFLFLLLAFLWYTFILALK